jgi:hypothetical protein
MENGLQALALHLTTVLHPLEKASSEWLFGLVFFHERPFTKLKNLAACCEFAKRQGIIHFAFAESRKLSE